MKKTLHFLLLVLPCCIASAQSAKHPDYTPLIEKYRGIFLKEMKQYHDAGMSIALVDGDSIVWCEGFGYFNQADKQKVTGHTPFHIGSVCKVFTGLAVMQLQEKGKLNIDKPFAAYVPAFHMKSEYGSIKNISPRMILSHHAGIPDFIKDKFRPVHPYFTGVLDFVNDDYATFPPNTIFSYSNAGFSILGNLIENVSKTSYYNYIQKNILSPLQMHETGFVTDTAVPLSVRLGYSQNGKEFFEQPVFDAPAGCIYSTAFDMAQFIKVHLNKGVYNNQKIFDSGTLFKMMEDQSSSVGLDFGEPYGLAWSIYYNNGGKSIHHGGGTLYHRAQLSISPYAKLGVVMLSNSASGKPLLHADYDILNEAMQIKGLAPIPLPRLHMNKITATHNITPGDSSKTRFRFLNHDELMKYEGSYGTFGTYFNIAADTNLLIANMGGQQFYMLPAGGDLFAATGTKDTADIHPFKWYYFEQLKDKLLLVQIDNWGHHSILGEKIKKITASETWKQRLGKYICDGQNGFQMLSDFELHNKDSILFLSARLNINVGFPVTLYLPLKIINDNLAKVYGYSRLSGQYVQFKGWDKKREVMKFMGFNCSLSSK